MRLQVYGDEIIRVTSTPTRDVELPPSLMVTAKPLTGGFTVTERPGNGDAQDRESRRRTSISRPAMSSSTTPAAAWCLAKAALRRSRRPTPRASRSSTVRQQFNRGTDEGFYGLGQHQNRQMNYNGEDVELAQHNMDVAIPFVVSTRNYGVLWDNNSITRFGDPEALPLRRRRGRRAERQWRHRLDRDLQRQWQDHRQPAGAGDRLQYLENLKDWPAGHADRRP